MKITITSIEGEPSELAELPALEEVLTSLAAGAVGPVKPPSEPTPDINVENVSHFIELRGRRNRHVQLVKEFVVGCLEFDDAEPVLGDKPKSPDGFGDYLRVKHRRSRYGGFVYVTPSNGKVEFRLTREHADGRAFAVPLAKKDQNYQVRIYLTSEEAVQEALELAELAYDGVKP